MTSAEILAELDRRKTASVSRVDQIMAEIEARAERRRRRERAALAQTSLLSFVEHTHPDYSAGWFHREVCAALEKFSADVAAKKSPRLILCAPPRHGKTAIVSKRWPVWHLGRHPRHEIACASYGDELAQDNSRDAREIARSDEAAEVFQALRPLERPHSRYRHADLDKVSNWKTALGGSYKAVGLGGQLTGRGAHVLVIDDPIKDQAAADSAATREAAFDWYAAVARTRLAPGGGVLLMQTRWHEADLVGRLLALAAADPDADQWTVLSFPAIADEDEPHRKAGEALDPERYPLAELSKIRASIGARKFEALYQQRPTVQGGNMIRASWLSERYTCRPEDIAATADEVWISVDAAKKKGSLNDFHAIHVWARKGAQKYLLDRRTERMGYPEFEDALDGMIAKWRPFIVRTAGGALIEDTANGTTYLQVRAHTSPVPLVGFSPARDTPGRDSSKTARAIYLQRACEAGQVILPDASVMPTVEEVVICWTAFPSGLHDDDVDAASQLIMRWMLGEAEPDLDSVNAGLLAMLGMG